MSSVTAVGVSKRFGDVVAVDDLDLSIVDGEFMVLLGPSGCGKTTLLRLIAGLEVISDGTMSIGESVVNDVEAKDRDVSMVFQSYALYPHMTVAKNIESPLIARTFDVGDGERRKLTPAERRERVLEGAESLGLIDLLDRKPGALSGGQRQRVALARAIVSRPSAFLMDEPLSNLDATLRAQTRVELVELHQRLATTFIYVTHDQIEAMTMATRIAVIADGRLQQVGTPREVYERPANLFVARFIGSPPMNSFPSTEKGVDVILGVRAEHLQVVGQSDAPTEDDGRTFEITVKSVEWLGHERQVICTLGAETVVLRQPTDGDPPSPGSVLTVAAHDEHLHRFDASTGARL